MSAITKTPLFEWREVGEREVLSVLERVRQWWRDSAPVSQRDFEEYVTCQNNLMRRLWTRIDVLESWRQSCEPKRQRKAKKRRAR